MKKIQYSVAMMKNPIHPDEPRKAYANLQLTGWSETTRVLTPQQVRLIVETIGDP